MWCCGENPSCPELEYFHVENNISKMSNFKLLIKPDYNPIVMPVITIGL